MKVLTITILMKVWCVGLANILLKFQVQLHQLTPNAMVQLSKYIWAVMSFGGVPCADGFAKR
jgi:hypothetical protein